jgi:hypothetical protein
VALLGGYFFLCPLTAASVLSDGDQRVSSLPVAIPSRGRGKQRAD